MWGEAGSSLDDEALAFREKTLESSSSKLIPPPLFLKALPLPEEVMEVVLVLLTLHVLGGRDGALSS